MAEQRPVSDYSSNAKMPGSRNSTITVCPLSNRVKNLEGKRFGKLFVERFIGVNGYGTAVWGCLCECGKRITISASALVHQGVESCGCNQKAYAHLSWDSDRKKSFREKFPEYQNKKLHYFWTRIKYYTTTTKLHSKYLKTLRKKGITICEEWMNYSVFEKWALEQGWKEEPGFFIGRKDSFKGWCPENCIVANVTTARGYKPGHLMYTHNGKTQCLSAWARELGMDYHTLQKRLDVCHGDISKAMQIPRLNYPKTRASRLPAMKAKAEARAKARKVGV